MSENRTSLEIIAPSAEEAIEKGLADLGLPREAVEVEILDEGSRGLFGLGSRQARVRLTVLSSYGIQPPAPAPIIQSPDVPAPGEGQSVAPQVVKTAEKREKPPVAAEPVALSNEDQIAVEIAQATVAELLEHMRIYDVDVSARIVHPEEGRGRPSLWVDIEGDDLAILIGPQAENLQALQYIAGLIIGKELGRSMHLTIDVQGYRNRRASALQKLAQRMAEQAVKTGKRQFLEPMPANERRLIHLELRDHPDVITESVGEDPRRKVSVIPKA
jgi:spoIIIJ-associated protein